MYLFIITLLSIFLLSNVGLAQRGMIKVHFKDTTTVKYPLDRIDSLTHFSIDLATIITLGPQSITGQSFYCGGKILSNGKGNISEVGLCWSSKPNPTRSNAWIACNTSDSFYYCMIEGLTKKTTYYVRAYAINEAGISYGEEISVSTSTSGGGTLIHQGYEYNTFIGCDGNEYLAENFKSVIYQNGDTVRKANSYEDLIDAWEKKEGAWCYYNFDEKNDSIYGKLYNIYALYDERNLEPIGWYFDHYTPTNHMNRNVYGCYVQEGFGGKLKSIGTVESGDGNWKAPNTGATNEIGFSGQPGGILDFRFEKADFRGLGEFGYWRYLREEYYLIKDEIKNFPYNFDDYADETIMSLSYNSGSATLEVLGKPKKYMTSIRCVRK
jgi:uncharacterized protein (TIGR02145 family)